MSFLSNCGLAPKPPRYMSGLGVSVKVKLPKEISAAAKQIPALEQEFAAFTDVLKNQTPGVKATLDTTNALAQTIRDDVVQSLPYILGFAALVGTAWILLKKGK